VDIASMFREISPARVEDVFGTAAIAAGSATGAESGIGGVESCGPTGGGFARLDGIVTVTVRVGTAFSSLNVTPVKDRSRDGP
jgi:hypothetical protein